MAKFKFLIEAKEKLLLPPYKGSTLRGGFGHAFKRASCINRKTECADCILREKCVYSYVFETPPPSDAELLRKYPTAPHPFVIEPPLDEKTDYSKAETLNFGLVLVGRAIEYLPYFIYAFDELGRIGLGRGRGKFQLDSVYTETQEGDTLVYSSKDKTLSNAYKVLGWEELLGEVKRLEGCDQLELHFLSPTRIKYQGRLTSDLPFHVLIRTLIRRLSLLTYFHCQGRIDLDFKGLIERAQKVETIQSDLTWHDWERFSRRQNSRMKLGGFMGKVAFSGRFHEFLPLLVLGSYLHIGKGSSFGLGRYELCSIG